MKFKICPHCGRRNSPTAFDCEDCYTDLTAVRVTDEKTGQGTPTPEPALKNVRVCEACGFSNPANARKCRSCGEDISDVIPTEEVLPQTDLTPDAPHFTLVSLDGEYAYELQPGMTVVGREETMSDYLSGKIFVSRRHAELILEDGKLRLRNLSRSNYSFVNNERCTVEPMELHDGDELGLGGNVCNGQRQDRAAYFLVRIGSCS